jgi:hypothetical protein
MQRLFQVPVSRQAALSHDAVFIVFPEPDEIPSITMSVNLHSLDHFWPWAEAHEATWSYRILYNSSTPGMSILGTRKMDSNHQNENHINPVTNWPATLSRFSLLISTGFMKRKLDIYELCFTIHCISEFTHACESDWSTNQPSIKAADPAVKT